MTTNARDEKWSEWIDWSGGECPLPDGVTTEVKLRGAPGDERLGFSDKWEWSRSGYGADIIAYRYKIEEPESYMHPDLEWLARACDDMKGALYISREDDGFSLTSKPYNHAGSYHHDTWLQARKDLGLIMSDEEEEMKAEERPKRNLYEEIKEGFDALASDRTDNVNKPKHYQLREGYEVYDLRQDLAAKAANGGATYDQYSDWDRAIEYIIRMWGKNRLEDAKKGRWYLDKLIEKLEKQ